MKKKEQDNHCIGGNDPFLQKKLTFIKKNLVGYLFFLSQLLNLNKIEGKIPKNHDPRCKRRIDTIVIYIFLKSYIVLAHVQSNLCPKNLNQI